MKSGQRPAKKAGRAYGVNAGLAVAGRNRNRVKNRQSGRKLFFGLIFFGPFLYQDKKGLGPPRP